MKCCERDHNNDGNCDRHPARQLTRKQQLLLAAWSIADNMMDENPYANIAALLEQALREEGIIMCYRLPESGATLPTRPDIKYVTHAEAAKLEVAMLSSL